MKSNKGCIGLMMLGLLALCGSSALAQGIVYGDSAAMGQGIVSVWSDTLGNGAPQRIGITFSEGALTALPQIMVARSLELPDIGAASPFEHVFLVWNPAGHDPAPIYGAPHFDIHFYVIPDSERNAIIPGTDPVPVEPQFLPPNYANGDGFFAVPGMGVHYVDTTSAEFHGQPFTTTMIYGFYHGDFIFVEPMITLAYLQTEPDTTMVIHQPQAYQETGYYPTSYSIVHSSVDNSVTVTLEDFVFQTAAAVEPQSGVTPPADFVLLKNYPNPFNPQTTIEYVLPQSAPVTLKVFNVNGEEVAMLVNGMQGQGAHSVAFDASDLSSGVYLYRLQAGAVTATRKMLLVR